MIKSYRRMLQAAGSFAPEMRLALQLSALASVIQGIIFALFFPLLRTLFTHPLDGGTVWTILGIMMGLILLEAIVRWQEMGITHAEAMVRISHELRLKLGEQLRCMPLEQLNRRQAGDLSMVLSGNVMDVTLPMSNILGMIIQTIVVPIVTIAATFFFDWRLALVLLVAFPLSAPLYQRLHTLNLRGFREMNAVNAKAASRIIEYVQGLPVLRATNQVGKQAGQLQEALVNQHTTQVHSHQLVTIPHVLMSTLVQSSILLVLALGALFILQGTLTLPVLGALLVIAVRFSEPISQLAAFNQVFDLMESGLERIEELLAVQPLSSSTTPAHITQHDITFEHVSFTYTDQPESVLHNVSFHLPPHSFTALVGPSGGGKTTITRLISRYADVQHGSVCIGGIDVRNVEPSELMRHISVVFQDVYLFDDTILANIRLARLDASDAEIEEAARAANCHEFITRLPQGYETRIGEIGNMLSGGERQRIAIARALLKDTPIVLLDEPTSALDTESEAAVQTAIDRLVADRTIVVIAHRLSTIVAADTILVLDGGSIVEQGSHTELLAHEGRYAAMWRAQQSTQRWRVGTAQ